MHIIVFLTYGVSLKSWQNRGLIERELLIYKKFVENGYRITLFTYGGKEDLEFKDLLGDIEIIPAYATVKRHNNKMLRLLISFAFPWIFKDLFKFADIYKTNQMKGSWVPVIAKLLYKKKLVIRCGYELLQNALRDNDGTLRSAAEILFYFILEAISYLTADTIIMSSEENIKFIKERFRVSSAKIRLIRNFVDTERFAPGERSRLPNNDFFSIGRMVEVKNFKLLLFALRDSSIKLDIIGEGEEEHRLKESAKGLGVNINFLGTFPNSDLPEIINNYGFFILPSIYENSPKALLEAMACERVVIGTNVAGIKELVSDGQTGFLCEPDPDSVRRAIKKVMDLNVEEREKIGENAREFAINKCGLEKVYAKEKNIYENFNNYFAI